jgi:hypothetical protein
LNITSRQVEEFRDVLVEHTAELEQKAIATGGQAAVPQHQAQVHRLRVALDNLVNCLNDQY